MRADTDRTRFDAWQWLAVDKWVEAKRCGIVQAVTGSGKTHVAYKAIRNVQAECAGRLYTLIVVPTIVLMKQWREGLKQEIPGIGVGLLGGDHHNTFGSFDQGRPIDALVATMHSAAAKLDTLVQHRATNDRFLLIADECHHVVSPKAILYPKVLKGPFDYRMGLTATLSDWALDGLGKTVYEYTLSQAVQDGVIPRFWLINVAVQLTPSERDYYSSLGNQISDLIAHLKSAYEIDVSAL